MSKIKTTCPCGATLELDAEYLSYQFDPWLKVHAECLKKEQVQTLQPIKYPNVGPPQVWYGDPQTFTFTTTGSGLHYQ